MEIGINDPRRITNEKHNHTEGTIYKLLNAGNM